MIEIVAENVSIGYRRDQPILQNIFFKISRGIHVLLGANGSGKTTLLKTIAGLLSPLKGRIIVNGIEPYKLKRREAAKLIAYTWQNPYYGFIEARVIDEIRFILRTTGLKGNWEIVGKLVPTKLYERNPYTLSGGEAKRVSIASVLVGDQDVWLLDEPFIDLDYEGVYSLLEILREARKKGKLIIIASHLVPLMDQLKPDKYLLITRDKKLIVNDWSKLTDNELISAGVLTRSMICGSYC